MKPVGGSFRDPDSRIYSDGSGLARGLSEEAFRGLSAAVESGLGDVVPLLDWAESPPSHGWDHIIRPAPLPLISRPSEWSFGMLQRAALAMLDLVIHAAEHGYSVVDATAHNFTFRGTELSFFDHGSFRPGPFRRWDAYGQFCDEFLAPLLLEAHAGIPFQPYLRGRLNGLPITELAPLLKGTARFKPGVLGHVHLRARLERRAQTLSAEQRRALSNEASPGPAAVSRIAQKLRTIVSNLSSTAPSTWADYTETCTYEDDQTAAKRTFVLDALAREARRGWAWDIGANTGDFSRLLAQHFDHVLALEQDPGAVDAMFHKLGAQSTVHPIVADVTDPPAPRGVMLTERKGLAERAPAEVGLFLAVVHHLAIGAGLPLWKIAELARWVAPEVVVEFVAPEDEMVEQLVASRPLAARGYDQQAFEAAFSSHFEVLNQAPLTSTRTIYHMVTR